MSRLEISGTGLPGATTVRLDGQDIIRSLRGLTLTMAVDQLPMVGLDVSVFEGVGLDVEDVQVFIPEATRELLARLGWTPPHDPDPAAVSDARQRARDWIDGFRKAPEDDQVNCVALLLDAADAAYKCVAEGHKSRLARAERRTSCPGQDGCTGDNCPDPKH